MPSKDAKAFGKTEQSWSLKVSVIFSVRIVTGEQSYSLPLLFLSTFTPCSSFQLQKEAL